MVEEYVLVECEKTIGAKIVSIVVLVLGIISAVMALAVPVMLPVAAVILIAWYFACLKNSKEYESSYFDGEVRFAKIKNKSRRKRLRVFTMDNVIQIAPAGDRSVSRYENDRNVKRYNYTSGKKDAPYYEMIVKEDGDVYMISFEPDEKYLDAVCLKYAPKVVRK